MAERRLVGWLRERHSLAAEAGVIVLLYALYETSRGLVAGDRAGAVHHAHTIAAVERSLHVFAEADVQRAAGALPGLVGTLGVLPDAPPDDHGRLPALAPPATAG